MRKITLPLILIVAGIGFIYYRETSPCRNPIVYDIGDFDARFNISRDKFLKTIKEAEIVWEKGSSEELFIYQPGAKFKINLVFDDRQSKTIQATRSKQEIEQSRPEYDSMVIDYKAMSANYNRTLDAYNYDLSIFEEKLINYNKQVAEINKRGGATPQEFKQLEEIKKELEQNKNSLDARRISLNQTANDLNDLGNRINSIAGDLNIDVDIHNQRFGEAREFDQGDYLSNRINIYQYNGVSDLRLVLAHELGHALSLEHVENPKSIMYYLMDKQDLNNPSLTREDREAFLNRCRVRVPKLQELFGLFITASPQN